MNVFFKFSITSTILTLLLISGAKAQESPIKNSLDHSSLNRGFGMHMNIPTLSIGSESNINEFLKTNGYPGIPQMGFSWGIGLTYRISNLITGMDVMVGSQTRINEYTGSETLVRPLHANIWTGFYTYKWKDYMVYPLAGLYITDTNYIFSQDVGNTSFQNVFLNNRNAVNLQNLSAGLFLGTGFDINRLWLEDSPLLSLKLGYRIPAFGDFEWESNFANLSNPPTERFGHWYLQLQFGFMHNYKKGSR